MRSVALLALFCAALAASGCVVEPTTPAPAPRVEVIPAQPVGAVRWAPGHWAWRGGAWAWIPGHWV